MHRKLHAKQKIRLVPFVFLKSHLKHVHRRTIDEEPVAKLLLTPAALRRPPPFKGGDEGQVVAAAPIAFRENELAACSFSSLQGKGRRSWVLELDKHPKQGIRFSCRFNPGRR